MIWKEYNLNDDKLQDLFVLGFNHDKRQFFYHWNELDLGNETLEEHFNNCKFNFPINKSGR